MKILLTFLTLLTFSLTTHSQESLLNEKDIVWLSEINFPLVLAAEREITSGYRKELISKTLKLSSDKEKTMPNDIKYYHTLAHKIIHSILNKNITVYKTPKLINPLEDSILNNYFKEESYIRSKDNQKIVLSKPLSPETVEHYSVQAHIYYHRKNKLFIVKPFALAVVTRWRRKHEELFWIPVTSVKNINLTQNDIIWAKSVNSKIALKDSKILKSSFSLNEVWEFIFNEMQKNDFSLNYFDASNPFDDIKLSNKQILSIAKRDSIYSYSGINPKTQQETDTSIRVTYDWEDFAGIDIICDWAWNQNKHQVIVKSKNFGPYVASYNINGEKHRSTREALFYIYRKEEN